MRPASIVATGAGLATFTLVVLITAAHRPRSRTVPPREGPLRVRRRPSRRALVAGPTALALVPAVVVLGPLLVVVSAAVVGGAIVRHRQTTIRRARQAVDEAMPDVVELLVLCVHAGRSPNQAIVELAARAPPVLRDAFAAVELQLHRGRSLADALGELPRTLGPVGRDLATAVAGADRDGLPLAPVLDRLAAEARTARRRLGDAEARRLPVRLTFPLVGCTLPSFVLLAIAPAVLGALSTLRATAP